MHPSISHFVFYSMLHLGLITSDPAHVGFPLIIAKV